MSRFRTQPMQIPGVQLVERRSLADERGSLTRVFCSKDLEAVGWKKPIAQINHTVTALAGTVRGLHFQRRPSCEMKLVMCLKGEIFDVAVDLRRGSPTFLQHEHAILSAENKMALLIPEGFAHGFQALTDGAEIFYLNSAPYDPAVEDGVSPFEPRLGIEWPRAVSVLSDRDAAHPPLDADFAGFEP